MKISKSKLIVAVMALGMAIVPASAKDLLIHGAARLGKGVERGTVVTVKATTHTAKAVGHVFRVIV
jgi:hypothetical protein